MKDGLRSTCSTAAENSLISIAKIAAELLTEHASARRDNRFAETHGIGDLVAAYEAQDAFVDRLLENERTTVTGYKLGLTSVGMQQMSGITHPVAGVVLANTVFKSPHRLTEITFSRLAIEFEVVVRLKHDLCGPGLIDIETVAAAADGVAPAIELVDVRNADLAAIDCLSLVAQNAWGTGLVLGQFQRSWPDLSSIVGCVTLNGEPIDEGTGSMALGHPFASVAWLANHFIARGKTLKAGSIVSTGNIAKVRFPVAGQSYRFILEGLGDVAIDIQV